MKLWYFSKLLKRMKCSNLFDKDVTENQHAVKVLTQKCICETVLTVEYEWQSPKL